MRVPGAKNLMGNIKDIIFIYLVKGYFYKDETQENLVYELITAFSVNKKHISPSFDFRNTTWNMSGRPNVSEPKYPIKSLSLENNPLNLKEQNHFSHINDLLAERKLSSLSIESYKEMLFIKQDPSRGVNSLLSFIIPVSNSTSTKFHEDIVNKLYTEEAYKGISMDQFLNDSGLSGIELYNYLSTGAIFFSGNLQLHYMPFQAILTHELIHILHNATYTNRLELDIVINRDQWVDPEEFWTTLGGEISEYAISAHLGVPPRIPYSVALVSMSELRVAFEKNDPNLKLQEALAALSNFRITNQETNQLLRTLKF